MRSRKKLFYIPILALILLFSLTACSSNDKASGDKQDKAKKEQTDKKHDKKKKSKKKDKDATSKRKVSTSVKQIMKEKPGKYAGHLYNEAVVHNALNDKNFQEKSSIQVYNYLLSLMGEGKHYKKFYNYYQKFNPKITSEISKMPGGMQISGSGDISLNTNIAILLDASGSMAQKIGGKTKMELAKKAINDFVSTMPEGANVMLRVYGQKGSSSDSDKKLSCKSTKVVYDFQPYNKDKFHKALNKFQPKGWTPLGKAISETKKDFKKADDGENIIYVVSDGVETCGGHPAKAAKQLHDSNIKAVVNIIGFDVNSNGQQQLMKAADAGGGEFKTVDSAEDFKNVWSKERRRLFNEWWDWSNKNWNNVWDEQNKKENDLYEHKSNVSNLIYREKSRMKEASYYLQDKKQYDYKMRQEIDSIIDQRYDILNDYYKNKFDKLKETLKTNGDNLKDKIKKKGKEMKEKYKD